MKDILNNITAAKLNTLDYGDTGKVRFQSGTPTVYRYPFFTKGGNNLASYHTKVMVNKETNTLDLKISKSKGLLDHLLNKINLNYSVKKSFPIIDNSHALNNQVIKFISTDEIHNFVKGNSMLLKILRFI